MGKKSWPSPDHDPPKREPRSEPRKAAPERTTKTDDQQVRQQQELARQQQEEVRVRQAEQIVQQRTQDLRRLQAQRDEALRQQQQREQAERARIEQEAISEQAKVARLQALAIEQAARKAADLKRQQEEERAAQLDAQKEREALTKVVELMNGADQTALAKRSQDILADIDKHWRVPHDTTVNSAPPQTAAGAAMTSVAYMAALEKLGMLYGANAADKQVNLKRGMEQFAEFIKYIRGTGNNNFKKPNDEQYALYAQLLGMDKQALQNTDGGVPSAGIMRRVAEISASVEAFQNFYNQTRNSAKNTLPVHGIPDVMTMQKMIVADVLPSVLGVPDITTEATGADADVNTADEASTPDVRKDVKKLPNKSEKQSPINDVMADTAYVTLPVATAVPLAGAYAMRNQLKRLVPQAVRNLASRTVDALPARYKVRAKIGLATIAGIFGADYFGFGKDSLVGAALAKARGETLATSTGEEYKTLGIVHGVSATVIGTGVVATHVKKHLANVALKKLPEGTLKDLSAQAKAMHIEPRSVLDKLKNKLGRAQIGKLVGIGLAGWGLWKLYENQSQPQPHSEFAKTPAASSQNSFIRAYRYAKDGIKDFSTGIIATLAGAGLIGDLRRGLKNNTQRTAFGIATTGLLMTGLEAKEAYRNGDRPLDGVAHGWISTLGVAALISHIAGHNAKKIPGSGISPFTKYALIPALLYSGLHGMKNYLTKAPELKPDTTAQPLTAKAVLAGTSDALSVASVAALVLGERAKKAFTPLVAATTVLDAAQQLADGDKRGAIKTASTGTSVILGKAVGGFIAKRMVGAATGFFAGTVWPGVGNIVGGISGLLFGDKAVDIAVDTAASAAKVIREKRQEIMDDRWKQGGEPLTSLLIDKIPAQASPGVLSPRLQAIAEAKATLNHQTETREALLLKQKQGQPLSVNETASLTSLEAEIEQSKGVLTVAAQRIVKQAFSDGMSPDMAKSDFTRELANAAMMQRILTPEPTKTEPRIPPLPVPSNTIVVGSIEDKIAKGRELAQLRDGLKEHSGSVVLSEAEKSKRLLAQHNTAASSTVLDTVADTAYRLKEKAWAMMGYSTSPAPIAVADTKHDPHKGDATKELTAISESKSAKTQPVAAA